MDEAFTETQIHELKAKLSKSAVSTRDKSGVKLSYIEGWHAIAEANRIFGFGNWDRVTERMDMLAEPTQNEKKNWNVAYMAKVLIRVRTGGVVVEREGCGFGSGFARNVGDAHESAIKEAETDAMKRAFMTFGNQFGLALYDKKQLNVAAEWRGPIAKTELKKLAQEICTELKSCTDKDQLSAYWTSAPISAPLTQMQHDLPDEFDACVEHKDRMKVNLTAVEERGDIDERTAIEGEGQ